VDLKTDLIACNDEVLYPFLFKKGKDLGIGQFIGTEGKQAHHPGKGKDENNNIN
jgi:hypothetical protein